MLASIHTTIVFQIGGTQIRPWQENWIIDAISIGTALFIIAAIWLWARSGRRKADKSIPFDRTAENFAGTVWAAYGPIPIFLYVAYGAVLIAAVLYTLVSILNGVQY